jgi:hypothetical protein
VDDRTGGVGEPVAVGFRIGGDPWLPAIDLLGEDQNTTVPIGEMAQHAGDRPVLVRGSGKGLIVDPLAEGTEPLALTRVHVDVGTILSHRSPPISDR